MVSFALSCFFVFVCVFQHNGGVLNIGGSPLCK